MKNIFSIISKKRHYIFINIYTGFVFIAATIFLQSSVVAQMKQNVMSEHTNKADSSKGITIHQEVYFKVSPQRVYEALLSSKQFSEFTAKSGGGFSSMSANIDNTTGGAFSVFDGHITGRILELVPNQRIVEAWRVVDWPSGVYSIAKFELKSQGSGTQLIFDHTGFPENLQEHLAMGWRQHYWNALTTYFQ